VETEIARQQEYCFYAENVKFSLHGSTVEAMETATLPAQRSGVMLMM
jgi:hypothetical protein